MSNNKLSRSVELIIITREYLADSGISELGFSKILWLNYLGMVPAHGRSLAIEPWHSLSTKDTDRIISKQYTRFLRYLDGSVTLPCELEEAWIEALEEPYRSRAIQRLCSRYGIQPVDITPIEDAKRVSLCIGNFSNFLGPLGKMLDDSKFDAADLPHLQQLEDAANALVGQIKSVVHTAQVKTGSVDNSSKVDCH